MNLIIDIGNTRTKIALFKDNEIIDLQVIKSNPEEIENIVQNNSDKNIIVSSVSIDLPNIKENPQLIFFNKSTPIPISNSYLSSSIGVDRIAAAIGAFSLFKNTDCLIFDLGSAITIDFLSKNNTFRGGNISPGMSYRFKSLNQYTKRLPLINKNGDIELISKTTEDAIRSGVIYGITYELHSYISEYKSRFSNIKVILTGGDAKFFAKQLKKRIFANEISKTTSKHNLGDKNDVIDILTDENIVLKGLNFILNFNLSKPSSLSKS